MLSHDHVENSAKQDSLAKHIEGLTSGDFYPYTLPVAYAENDHLVLTAGPVIAALWQFVGSPVDRQCMEEATAGSCDELMLLVAIECDHEEIELGDFQKGVFDAFGGEGAFLKQVRTILDQTSENLPPPS